MAKSKVTVEANGTISGTSEAFEAVFEKAKKKIEDVYNPEEKSDDENKRPFVITKASIRDNYCDYSFKIVKGVGIGDKNSTTGTNLVYDSMLDAFARFNVHLACLDDAFKNSNIEFEHIHEQSGSELTFQYVVTGFEIKGSNDDESIVLFGNKYSHTACGRFDTKTPKVALDALSSYKWYNELKQDSDNVREQVALYKEGNYQIAIVDDAPNPKQTKISFGTGESETKEGDNTDDPNNDGDQSDAAFFKDSAAHGKMPHLNLGDDFDKAKL